jgi:hypothetical protein
VNLVRRVLRETFTGAIFELKQSAVKALYISGKPEFTRSNIGHFFDQLSVCGNVGASEASLADDR